MPCQAHRLSNGATFLQIPMEGVKSATVLALINAGRRYEEDRVAGISHFLEHMVFKGTTKFPTAQQLAEAIDSLGGEFNAFTSKEYTGYYAKLASRYLDTALDVVTDMVCAPLLRQEDIDRESGVIVEEINMYEDMPMRNIQDIFDRLMFGGTNLEGKILGTKETVKALKSEDFLSYMQQWYGFPNVVIVIAGDASLVGDERLVEKVSVALMKGGEERQAQTHKPFFTGKYGEGRRVFVHKQTEQAHFVLGFPSYARDDVRRYALSVLTTLMGKTMSSRLFSEVREKRGLCYYVRAENDFYHDSGVFGAAAGVDPARLQEAVQVTIGEFQSLITDKPVLEHEVQSAKQNLIGGLLLELEDSQSLAGWHGMKQLLEGKVESEEDVVARVEAVTLADVQAVAHDLIKPGTMRFALIGPFHEGDIEVPEII